MKKKAFFVLCSIIMISLYLFLRPSIRFKETGKILEKDSICPYESVLLSYDGTITAESGLLDTSVVGKHKFLFTVQKGIFKKEILYHYEVKDTTPPSISIKEKTIQLEDDKELTEEEMRNNISISEGDFLFSTDYDKNFPGTYEVNVHAFDEYGNSSEDSFTVVVKDREEPFVFRTGNGAKILLGSKFDISDIISYGDNVDDDPVLTVEGKVNTSVSGSYPLHLTLTDSSGNIQEWDPVIKVVRKLPETVPTEIFYPFETFKKDYEGEGREFGLDISEWQREVDYEKVKNSGCDFVILRIGWCFEGELHIDQCFHQNLKAAREAGLKVGAYLFCYEYREEDLKISLKKMFEELDDVPLELPLVFDWENFSNYQQYEMSFRKLNHLYDIFEQEVKKHGYDSMLYGSQFYLDTVWKEKESRPIWLAQYIDWPSYSGPYRIWQVSDIGQIDGIDGHVDLDILFR